MFRCVIDADGSLIDASPDDEEDESLSVGGMMNVLRFTRKKYLRRQRKPARGHASRFLTQIQPFSFKSSRFSHRFFGAGKLKRVAAKNLEKLAVRQIIRNCGFSRQMKPLF